MTATRELIESHPFLRGMDAEARQRLAAVGNRIQFLAGAPVFSEGDRADRFWFIVGGHVRLDLHLPGTGTVVIETLGSGDVLGWSWLFPPYLWQFGATAIDPTLAVEFDGPGVRQLCDNDPALGYQLMQRFMRVVVNRLQATRIRLLDLYRLP
jgi:CRP/FNR family transcriptional regulator, cyclic AMP receptor protein